MQYEVTMRCTVKKIVTCEGCTEAEAREHPFDYEVHVVEADTMDWEVTNVRKIDA